MFPFKLCVWGKPCNLLTVTDTQCMQVQYFTFYRHIMYAGPTIQSPNCYRHRMYTGTTLHSPGCSHKKDLKPGKEKHSTTCRRRSFASPVTTVSELSEDSGVGSEEDLGLGLDQAWDGVVKYNYVSVNGVEEFTSDDDYFSTYDNISFLSESSKPHSRKSRSLDELTESLSIDCTISLLPPPVQYSDEKQMGNFNTNCDEDDLQRSELCFMTPKEPLRNYFQVKD